MTNGDGDFPEDAPTRDMEGRDFSKPLHQPPDDQFPQSYQGGPPTTGKVELETSDFVAMIVTFFFPGVGQMMLGQTVKGLVILGVALVTGCGLGLISIAAVVDAFLVANAKKRREIGDWEFFPDFQDTINL